MLLLKKFPFFSSALIERLLEDGRFDLSSLVQSEGDPGLEEEEEEEEEEILEPAPSNNR